MVALDRPSLENMISPISQANNGLHWQILDV